MNELHSNRLSIQLIRRLATGYPGEFSLAALQYLEANGESQAIRFLTVVMLRCAPTLYNLADPRLHTRERATKLLRPFMAIDPSFNMKLPENNVKLPEKLPDRTGVSHATAFNSALTGRTLDLLDETSHGRRLLPIVGHFAQNSDPRSVPGRYS